jgi:hypothetical protein
VFRVAAAPDRDRREPTLTGAPRLVSPDPSRLAPPERLTPIAARERARWLGLIPRPAASAAIEVAIGGRWRTARCEPIARPVGTSRAPGAAVVPPRNRTTPPPGTPEDLGDRNQRGELALSDQPVEDTSPRLIRRQSAPPRREPASAWSPQDHRGDRVPLPGPAAPCCRRTEPNARMGPRCGGAGVHDESRANIWGRRDSPTNICLWYRSFGSITICCPWRWLAAAAVR